jgi:hypothetical protein
MASRPLDALGQPAVKWKSEATIQKWEQGARKTGAHVTHPLAGYGDRAEELSQSGVSSELFAGKLKFVMRVICESSGKDDRASMLRDEFSGSYRKSHGERIVREIFYLVCPTHLH